MNVIKIKKNLNVIYFSDDYARLNTTFEHSLELIPSFFPDYYFYSSGILEYTDELISLAMQGFIKLWFSNSDLFITRLVRRIIEDKSNKVKDLIAIYFVTEEEVIEVEIDPNRGIVNWPEGFCDQLANEQMAIMRAGLERRKNKK